MDEWTGIAFGAFALSSFVSALRIGQWILHAEPRAIVNAGRWSLVLIALASFAVLLWLVESGRWTHAMLLAAFILPVLVQAAPRWRLLLGPFRFSSSSAFRLAPDFSEGGQPSRHNRMRGSFDLKLVEQCAAVLEAYLEQTRRQITYQANGRTFEKGPAIGSANGADRRRMSVEEALDVLGIEPTASAYEIKEAHRQLQEKLDPIFGRTKYFMMKINEAKDTLLGE